MKNIGKIINTKAKTILESCRKTLIFSSILFVLLIIQGVLFVAVEERYPILTFFYVFSLFVFLFILSVLISGATAQLYSEKEERAKEKSNNNDKTNETNETNEVDELINLWNELYEE